MTDKQIEFLDALESNLGIVSIACDKTNTDRETFDSWLNQLDFKKKYNSVREKSVDYVEHQLLKLINEGDLSAIQFYLKTQGKKRGY